MSSNLNMLYIYIWILDSMGFPYSARTLESEFGRRSYDLPKLEVIHSQILN